MEKPLSSIRCAHALMACVCVGMAAWHGSATYAQTPARARAPAAAPAEPPVMSLDRGTKLQTNSSEDRYQIFRALAVWLRTKGFTVGKVESIADELAFRDSKRLYTLVLAMGSDFPGMRSMEFLQDQPIEYSKAVMEQIAKDSTSRLETKGAMFVHHQVARGADLRAMVFWRPRKVLSFGEFQDDFDQIYAEMNLRYEQIKSPAYIAGLSDQKMTARAPFTVPRVKSQEIEFEMREASKTMTSLRPIIFHDHEAAESALLYRIGAAYAQLKPLGVYDVQVEQQSVVAFLPGGQTLDWQWAGNSQRIGLISPVIAPASEQAQIAALVARVNARSQSPAKLHWRTRADGIYLETTYTVDQLIMLKQGPALAWIGERLPGMVGEMRRVLELTALKVSQ